MNNSLQIIPIPNVPLIKKDDDLIDVLITSINNNQIDLKNSDILCVASKVIAITENRFIKLSDVKPSRAAIDLHKKIPRKSPEAMQLILDETRGDESNIQIHGSWIGAKGHIGRMLTSAGIDMIDESTAILPPSNPDKSAANLGKAIENKFNSKVGILITDSDGREGIAGATQLCVGLYGIPPIRVKDEADETICDMLAAAAGLVMGQRGNNMPAVLIRGFQYDFNTNAQLKDAY